MTTTAPVQFYSPPEPDYQQASAPPVIPHNRAAEEAVIGCAMINPLAVYDLTFLKPEHFYIHRLGWIWNAIISLEARRVPIDHLTITDELDRKGLLAEVGGPAYLTALLNVPNSINAEAYGRIVKADAVRRKMISAANKIAELAYDASTEIEHAVGEAISATAALEVLSDGQNLVRLDQLLGDTLDEISERAKDPKEVWGYATGLPTFDKKTGGLQTGELVYVVGGPGVGKCLGKDTPVLMYDGSVKNVQNIQEGEFVMGDDSAPRLVKGTTRGRGRLFKVTPVKGDSYVVNEDHILTLSYKGKIFDIALTEWAFEKSQKFRDRAKGIRVPVSFPENPTPWDAYMIGYWLGDGTSDRPGITTAEPEVVNYFQRNLPFGLEFYNLPSQDKIDYCIGRPGGTNRANEFLDTLRELDLIKNKHIPNVYKVNSEKVRLEILAGIIDSDGSLVHKCYDLTLKSKKLMDDIVFLARSLGFAAYPKSCVKSCTNSRDGNHEGIYYRAAISGNISRIPVKVERKKAISRFQIKDVLHTGITIESVGEGDYYGFGLDGNGRFLLGDFTVTHNTWLDLGWSMELGKQAPGAVISLEMKRCAIGRRLLSGLTGVSTRAMKSGFVSGDDIEKITQAIDEKTNFPVWVDDASYDTNRLRSTLAWAKREYGIRWFILDYALLLLDKGKDETEQSKLISANLKRIVHDLNLSGTILHSVVKIGMDAGDAEPRMSDQRGSGQAIHDADVQLFLTKLYESDPLVSGLPPEQKKKMVTLWCSKGRELEESKFKIHLVRKGTSPFWGEFAAKQGAQQFKPLGREFDNDRD